MRPNVIRGFAAGVIVGVVAVGSAATARADGYLDENEQIFVELFADDVICPTITQYRSLSGVSGVVEAIVSEGFDPDSAVDIVNFSVQEFCPQHWPLLVAIGKAARAANGGSLA